jgi:hypothetical protein
MGVNGPRSAAEGSLAKGAAAAIISPVTVRIDVRRRAGGNEAMWGSMNNRNRIAVPPINCLPAAAREAAAWC